MSSRNILLRCPFCIADRWVTLLTRGLADSAALRWRCTHCLQEWVELEGTVLPPESDAHHLASTVAVLGDTKPKTVI